MLVVTRRIGEEIMLPDCGVTITVVSVAGSKVKLGVTAPAGVPVHRSEVLEDARGAGCRNCPDSADGSSNLASAGTGCESAAAPLASTATQDMERELTMAIARRTGGKVRSLRVQILGDRVVVHGHTSSYYAVEMANLGLLEALDRIDADWPEKVEMEIEFDPPPVPTRRIHPL